MKRRYDNLSLDRRQFLTSTSLVALSQVGTHAATANDSHNLAAHIHPDVKYVRAELARQDN
ncbi:MAG: hypothetical protein KDA92_03405, partial [Planctomycetales bacterium]|nr:hypothetical protein [Planctomycetales bacterium]